MGSGVLVGVERRAAGACPHAMGRRSKGGRRWRLPAALRPADGPGTAGWAEKEDERVAPGGQVAVGGGAGRPRRGIKTHGRACWEKGLSRAATPSNTR